MENATPEHRFVASTFGGGSILAVDARSSRTFVRHSHDEFGVGLITGGAQRSWSGRGMVEAVCGDLITVNPGEVHDGTPVGAGRQWSMLYFSVEMVGRIVADLSECSLSPSELRHPVVRDEAVAKQFLATRAVASAGDIERDGLEERLLSLFASLFSVRGGSDPGDARGLLRARERIDDDPLSGHSLSQLASTAGLGRFQTLRGFARLTGLTPHAYVVQRRLNACRQAMRAGSSLADAAAGSAFADQSHMHRAFVARYGLTPGAYARAFRG